MHIITQFIIGTALPLFFASSASADAPSSTALPKQEYGQLDALIKQCEEQAHLAVCMRLGLYFENQGDLTKAAGYLSKACLAGDAPSCIKVAGYAEHRNDKQEALRWLRRACRAPQGDGKGCYEIAVYAEASGSKKSAAIWHEKACKKGYSSSCAKK